MKVDEYICGLSIKHEISLWSLGILFYSETKIVLMVKEKFERYFVSLNFVKYFTYIIFKLQFYVRGFSIVELKHLKVVLRGTDLI